MGRSPARLLAALVVSVAPLAAAAAGQAASLPIGSLQQATLVADQASEFGFSADSAGILTVFATADGDLDLRLEVVDAMGQQIEGGSADSDRFGDAGTETLSVILRHAGTYTVRVLAYYDGGGFQVGASWLPAESLALPEDPDGRPDQAAALTSGSSVEGSLDPAAGDTYDWYVLTAENDATYTIVTEGEDDVYIEHYADGEFTQYADRSDQDQGASGNESLTVRLRAGERAYFRIGSPFTRAATYSLRVGSM